MTDSNASFERGVPWACQDPNPSFKHVCPAFCRVCFVLIHFKVWALMRLQVVPQQLGGAGSHRIEWEIDDAVFKEAGCVPFHL